MTEQDEQDLRELQGELLAAEQSPWQPRCVARAFASGSAEESFVFTMQVWIDLEAAESPFLLGEFPESEDVMDRFEEAFRAFGHHETRPQDCGPEEMVLLGRMMTRAISRGFAMRLKLAPPEGCDTVEGGNGVGDWLPILVCLKSQIGFSLGEARVLPVEQAFALMAGHRCNEGWSVSGETYAMRDVPDTADQEEV